MSLKQIDIGLESTSQEILTLLETNTNQAYSGDSIIINDYTIGGVTPYDSLYQYDSAENRSIAFLYKERICVVKHGMNMIYTVDLDNSAGGRMWKPICHLPGEMDVQDSCLVVFRDEIHILGGYTTNFGLRSHYRYSGDVFSDNGTWVVESELPCDFCFGTAIVYKDAIHIFGGMGTKRLTANYQFNSAKFNNKHYKWDGTRWVVASVLPSGFVAWGCTAFVLVDKLHLVGGGFTSGGIMGDNKHYQWDGSSWIERAKFPVKNFCLSSCTITGGEYTTVTGGFTVGDTNNTLTANGLVYKYFHDGHAETSKQDTWERTGISLNSSIAGPSGKSIVLTPIEEGRGGCYVIGKRLATVEGGVAYHYGCRTLFDNLTTPVQVGEGRIVMYRGTMHYFGNRIHKEFRSGRWFNPKVSSGVISEIPYKFDRGAVVVFKDEIHVIGGYDSTGTTGVGTHYSWTPESGWKLCATLPYGFADGTAVVYDDHIHIIHGLVTKQTDLPTHYRLSNDGKTWEPVGRPMGTIHSQQSAIVCKPNVKNGQLAIYAIGAVMRPDALFDYHLLRYTTIGGWEDVIKLDALNTSIPSNSLLKTNTTAIVYAGGCFHVFEESGPNATTISHAIYKPSNDGIFDNANALRCIPITHNGRKLLFYPYKYMVGYLTSSDYDTSNFNLIQTEVQLLKNDGRCAIVLMLTKGQTVICNKAQMIPAGALGNNISTGNARYSVVNTSYNDPDGIYGLEEIVDGYKALYTAEYTFLVPNGNGDIDYHIET